MEEGIYYKRGSKSDFAGVEILGDAMELPRVIIEEIKFHETLKVQGKTERERWTCKLQGIEKPMLLNSTNRKRLAKRFWVKPYRYVKVFMTVWTVNGMLTFLIR